MGGIHCHCLSEIGRGGKFCGFVNKRAFLRRIYFDMAEVSNQLGDIKKAVDSYAEALKKKHSFLEARLALAKLYLQQGDLSSCDQECVVLLSVDQDNDEASLVREGRWEGGRGGRGGEGRGGEGRGGEGRGGEGRGGEGRERGGRVGGWWGE